MKHNDESGYTLVGVLAIFTIISIFGISLVMLSISSVKTSKIEHDDQSVFYIAEAGANLKVEEFKKAIEKSNDDYTGNYEKDLDILAGNIEESIKGIKKSDKYSTFEPNRFGDKTETFISYELIEEEQDYYKITSTGFIGNQSRTVRRNVIIDWIADNNGDGDDNENTGKFPPFAVFTTGEQLEIQKDSSIKGNIGTSSSKKNSIKLENVDNFNHKIYIPEKKKKIINYNGNFKQDIKDEKIVVKNDIQIIPKLPDFYGHDSDNIIYGETTIDYQGKTGELLLNEKNNKYDEIEMQDDSVLDIDMKDQKELIIKELDLQGNSTLNINMDTNNINLIFKEMELDNSTLNINTNGKNVKISVEEMKLQDNSTFNTTGGGQVTLFIDEKLEMQDSTFNSQENINNLNIYSTGEVELQNSELYGSIYIKGNNSDDSELELQSGSELHGNIFMGNGEIEIDESIVNSEIILVPNSEVDIEDAHIKGPIIAKEFEMDGGSLSSKPGITLDEDNPLSFKHLDFKWPDLGQGDSSNGDTNTPSDPDGEFQFKPGAIKEIDLSEQ